MSPDDANAPDRPLRDCPEVTPPPVDQADRQISEASFAPFDGHGADVEPVAGPVSTRPEPQNTAGEPAPEEDADAGDADAGDADADERSAWGLSAFIAASAAAARAEAERDDSSSLWGTDLAEDGEPVQAEVRRSAPGWAVSRWILVAAVAAGVIVASFVMIPRLFTPIEPEPAAASNVPPATTVAPTLAPPVLTYPDVVLASGPSHYWKFEMQAAGSDSVGTAHLEIGADASVLGSSAYGGGTGSLDCSGTAQSRALSGAPETPTGDFSIEAWINTVAAQGGPIVTFGNRQSGFSTRLDRVLYMATNGKIYFGTQTKGRQYAVSDLPVNTGVWRHVVGTMSTTAGITVYVDGQPAGTEEKATGTSDFEGYWKVCADNTAGWPGNSGRSSFTGTIDEVAVYPKALSAQEVLEHYDTAMGL